MKSNFLTRVITGLALVLFTVSFFFLRNISVKLFDIYTAFLIIVGTYELSSKLFLFKITKNEDGKEVKTLDTDGASVTAFVITMLSAFLVVPAFDCLKPLTAYCVIMAEAAIIAIVSIFSKEKGKLALKGLLTAVYPKLIMTAFLYANSLKNNSLLALILIFTIAPATDVMAYLVGSLLKGKKLCPKISPNKTISGAIGGLSGGIIVAVALSFILKPVTDVKLVGLVFAALGIFGSVLTQIGDLTESYIKRKLGVKDMGFIFPGHGGVLDRFDGISFAAVLVTIVVGLL